MNLETLGEQKSVIDHVAERLAKIDFTMQEAQNTLQTLQHERELAERMEQSIKQLRTKTAKADPPPQVGRLVGHGVGPRPRLEISRRKGQHAPRILDQDPAHHRLAHARLTKLRNDRRQDHVDSGPALLSQVPLCGEISGEQHAVLMPGVQHGEDRSDVLSGTTSSGLPE